MAEVANEIDVLGEMYFANCTTPLEAVLTTKETYYKLTGLITTQEFNCSGDGSDITIEYDGLYKVHGVATIYPSAGCDIKFSLFVNEVAQDNVCTTLSFKNNQDTSTFSGAGLVRLYTGDKVSIRAYSDTNLITLELTNFNLNIMRMGL